ncbi:hypothetical protein [Pseudanabaena sp. PCC 6802]|uniref:hypothetical protein n=1 Tax=Pseudanabaena sp. PCC 6802 TaxID=118173 RepID=UPI00034A295E|nr:hypothetical protein [Pseudanabaena sp. PCC 6802]
MSQFSSSYIRFYVITIAFVVALFSTVTSYGEKNLLPPPKVSGSYKIEPLSLPNCLKDKPLELEIAQSGIYLSGSLRSIAPDRARRRSTPQENLPLTGMWTDNKLSLVGTITHVEGCDRHQNLSIVATQMAKKLEGQISFAGSTSNFSAERQEETKRKKEE